VSLHLVSANMALLAIPDVDNNFIVSRNSVQILGYTSTISSIGSIVSGLLLYRYVNTE
jgi:hypothetical protein